MLEGTLLEIRWISWSWFRVGGRPLGISLNTLECLSMILWRSWGIDGLDGWTSSEHSCAIMPWCPFFNNFVMPLELITLLGFLLVVIDIENLLYSVFSSQCVWESHQTYFQIISNLHQIVEGLVGFFVCTLFFFVENIGVPQITMMLNWISLQTYVNFLKVSSTECKAQFQVPILSSFIEDNISEMEILSNKLSEDEIREMRGG